MNKGVSIAPLVLLSAVDHYERILGGSNAARRAEKRVVGVVLGEKKADGVRITNSFAIPFEEDETNEEIWFLDHNFIESMMEMFKKINAREKLVGWYHTGPKLRGNDLAINEAFKRFVVDPVVVVVDVNAGDAVDIPTHCYVAVEEVREDGSASERTFVHHSSRIEAEEAEEIGVEHLLRDVKDENSGNLTIRLSNNFKSLGLLSEKLVSIARYLERVMGGELRVNNEILGRVQEVFNLVPAGGEELVARENARTNDELMALYVGSLVRSIVALHDLIDNKIELGGMGAGSGAADASAGADVSPENPTEAAA